MKSARDFWVGDRFVRPSLGEIRLGLERVHIEPRTMEVLLALVERPAEVVPKQELIDAVWGEAFVSDEVLTHAIWDLRKAFGDHASDPEFIQTIPKKGYRLIAPVEEERQLEQDDDRSRPHPLTRRIAPGLALLAVLGAAAIWVGSSGGGPGGPRAAATETVLLLLPIEAPPGRADRGQRLDNHLRIGLASLEEIDLRRSADCAVDAAAERTYCLEPILISITDAEELSVSLRDASSAREVYSSRAFTLTTGEELQASAKELAALVGAYFDVIHDPYSKDPDLEPWFNVRGHDPRAIREFLIGVRYVYRHEIGGGRDPMAVAMRLDPTFIAPHVWRTPTIVVEGDAETRAAHHRALGRLYDHGDTFEKAMIRWAQAIIGGDVVEQIRQLNVALDEQPGNRPALLARASARVRLADFAEAWLDFDRLLGTRWDFPGLYPEAAYCAVRLDRLDALRRALDGVLDFEVVDINSLVLMRLLAIFDGRTEREAVLLAQLESRRKEQPEGLDPDLVRFVAEYLASKIEARDRPQIASRLRESAN